MKQTNRMKRLTKVEKISKKLKRIWKVEGGGKSGWFTA
jgi:hypothetical protein